MATRGPGPAVALMRRCRQWCATLNRWNSRRCSSGAVASAQDLFDEVWDGVLHINPAPSGRHAQLEAQLLAILRAPARAAGLTVTGQFNVGDDEHDYRVPDGGLHREFTDRVFYPTAALVIESISRGDSTGRTRRRLASLCQETSPAAGRVSWKLRSVSNGGRQTGHAWGQRSQRCTPSRGNG